MQTDSLNDANGSFVGMRSISSLGSGGGVGGSTSGPNNTYDYIHANPQSRLLLLDAMFPAPLYGITSKEREGLVQYTHYNNDNGGSSTTHNNNNSNNNSRDAAGTAAAAPVIDAAYNSIFKRRGALTLAPTGGLVPVFPPHPPSATTSAPSFSIIPSTSKAGRSSPSSTSARSRSSSFVSSRSSTLPSGTKNKKKKITQSTTTTSSRDKNKKNKNHSRTSRSSSTSSLTSSSSSSSVLPPRRSRSRSRYEDDNSSDTRSHHHHRRADPNSNSQYPFTYTYAQHNKQRKRRRGRGGLDDSSTTTIRRGNSNKHRNNSSHNNETAGDEEERRSRKRRGDEKSHHKNGKDHRGEKKKQINNKNIARHKTASLAITATTAIPEAFDVLRHDEYEQMCVPVVMDTSLPDYVRVSGGASTIHHHQARESVAAVIIIDTCSRDRQSAAAGGKSGGCDGAAEGGGQESSGSNNESKLPQGRAVVAPVVVAKGTTAVGKEEGGGEATMKGTTSHDFDYIHDDEDDDGYGEEEGDLLGFLMKTLTRCANLEKMVGDTNRMIIKGEEVEEIERDEKEEENDKNEIIEDGDTVRATEEEPQKKNQRDKATLAVTCSAHCSPLATTTTTERVPQTARPTTTSRSCSGGGRLSYIRRCRTNIESALLRQYPIAPLQSATSELVRNAATAATTTTIETETAETRTTATVFGISHSFSLVSLMPTQRQQCTTTYPALVGSRASAYRSSSVAVSLGQGRTPCLSPPPPLPITSQSQNVNLNNTNNNHFNEAETSSNVSSMCTPPLPPQRSVNNPEALMLQPNKLLREGEGKKKLQKEREEDDEDEEEEEEEIINLIVREDTAEDETERRAAVATAIGDKCLDQLPAVRGGAENRQGQLQSIRERHWKIRRDQKQRDETARAGLIRRLLLNERAGGGGGGGASLEPTLKWYSQHPLQMELAKSIVLKNQSVFREEPFSSSDLRREGERKSESWNRVNRDDDDVNNSNSNANGLSFLFPSIAPSAPNIPLPLPPPVFGALVVKKNEPTPRATSGKARGAGCVHGSSSHSYFPPISVGACPFWTHSLRSQQDFEEQLTTVVCHRNQNRNGGRGNELHCQQHENDNEGGGDNNNNYYNRGVSSGNNGLRSPKNNTYFSYYSYHNTNPLADMYAFRVLGRSQQTMLTSSSSSSSASPLPCSIPLPPSLSLSPPPRPRTSLVPYPIPIHNCPINPYHHRFQSVLLSHTKKGPTKEEAGEEKEGTATAKNGNNKKYNDNKKKDKERGGETLLPPASSLVIYNSNNGSLFRLRGEKESGESDDRRRESDTTTCCNKRVPLDLDLELHHLIDDEAALLLMPIPSPPPITSTGASVNVFVSEHNTVYVAPMVFWHSGGDSYETLTVMSSRSRERIHRNILICDY